MLMPAKPVMILLPFLNLCHTLLSKFNSFLDLEDQKLK